MIRKISILAVAAVIIAFAAGQAPAQHKWHGGLKLGFNSSQFRGDSVTKTMFDPGAGYYITGSVSDKLPGFVGGGFFRRDFGTWFAVQLELLYIQKGGQGPVSGQLRLEINDNLTYDGTVEGDLTLRMDYVEFPLLAVFRFPRDEKDKIGFIAEIGPSVGYNTRAEAQLTGKATVPLPDGSNRVQNFDQKIPIHANINRWAVTGVVGAALEFYLAKQTIVIDGRYEFDVTSISSDQSTYNHTFSLTVAFMAPITK
jgi:hypothetical protein